MLEDSTMDKKSAGRSAQIPTKGNGTEVKKTQDASSSASKFFPRGPRKRETNAPNAPKHDQNRKPQPQKSKAFDKRPRPRGLQCFAGGTEEPQVEDASGHLLASKKVNLNHLLNFHYASKEGSSNGHTQHGRWVHTASQKHKFSKEQFLQANCQFVVKAEGDYARYIHDPDLMVDWELIEQIRVHSSQLLSCPICLGVPSAARMTRCGHVYCWPCMLHYLALADKTWRPCPICYQPVSRDDLKSVMPLWHTELVVGNHVTMRLVRRERGSLLVEQVEDHTQAFQGGSTQVQATIAEEVSKSYSRYCKLLVITPIQVQKLLEVEMGQLLRRTREETGTPEICFTEQALEMLTTRMISLASSATEEDSTRNVHREAPEEDIPVEIRPSITPALVYESAFDNQLQQESHNRHDCVNSDEQPIFTCESVNSDGSLACESVSSDGRIAVVSEYHTTDLFMDELESHSQQAEILQAKYFYFYQAEDGQHLYLHSVNARMLEKMYGSLAFAPLTLRGRIVEKEAGSMTKEVRQRMRHLQHLPLTCQFEVAELELKPPLVSRDVITFFQDQLEQRRKKRQRRARDERRREKKILDEEKKRHGHFPAPDLSFESHLQFPECGNSPPSSISQFPAVTEETPPTEAFDDLQLDNSAGPSFAQMLREGKCQQRSVQPAVRRQAAPVTLSDAEPDQDGYVPAPSYSQSFGDAFALALERAASTDGDQSGGAAAGCKKKKAKQKVLFSTGMACNSK